MNHGKKDGIHRNKSKDKNKIKASEYGYRHIPGNAKDTLPTSDAWGVDNERPTDKQREATEGIGTGRHRFALYASFSSVASAL